MADPWPPPTHWAPPAHDAEPLDRPHAQPSRFGILVLVVSGAMMLWLFGAYLAVELLTDSGGTGGSLDASGPEPAPTDAPVVPSQGPPATAADATTTTVAATAPATTTTTSTTPAAATTLPPSIAPTVPATVPATVAVSTLPPASTAAPPASVTGDYLAWLATVEAQVDEATAYMTSALQRLDERDLDLAAGDAAAASYLFEDVAAQSRQHGDGSPLAQLVTAGYEACASGNAEAADALSGFDGSAAAIERLNAARQRLLDCRSALDSIDASTP
jgi:hypothetical protein